MSDRDRERLSVGGEGEEFHETTRHVRLVFFKLVDARIPSKDHASTNEMDTRISRTGVPHFHGQLVNAFDKVAPSSICLDVPGGTFTIFKLH